MSKPELNTLLKDPDLWGLPDEERKKFLNEVYPEFSKDYYNMPEQERLGFKNDMLGIQPEPAEPKEMFEPEKPVSTYEFGEYELGIGDLAAEAAPPVLAIVGSILGTGVGTWAGPAGTVGGGIGGAGIGGALGETYKQAWIGSTGRGKPAENVDEYFKRIGDSGLEEMLWESVGLAASIPFRAARGIGKFAKKTAEQYKDLGDIPPLTIGESLEHGTFKRKIVETIETLGTLGKHNIQKTRKAEIVGEAVKSRLHRGLKEGENLGNILHKTITNQDKAWRNLCDGNYEVLVWKINLANAKKGISNKFINTSELKENAKQLLILTKHAGVGGEVVTELERILKMPNRVSFDAAKLRWGALYNTTDKTLNKQLNKMGKDFKDDVGEQIKKVGPSLYNHWKDIEEVYKGGKKLFDEKIVKKIMHEMSDDDMYKQLIKPNNADNINTIKKLMTGEEIGDIRSMFASDWKRLQIVAHNKLIENATDVEGVLGGKKLKTQIKKMGSTFDAIFDPEDVPTTTLNVKAGIENLADYLTKLETRTGKITYTSLLVAAPFVGAAGYGLTSGDAPITGLIVKGGCVVGAAATFGLLSRTKRGLKILKTLAKTPVTSVEKVTSTVLRANELLDRLERRKEWLEKRRAKQEPAEKEKASGESNYYNKY